MQALSWALTAAAVLLVLYALRVVMQDRDPEQPGKQAGLGCGFFFLACLLWSLASHDWVGGWWNAFRLGMGIFLATPALGALTRPHGSRLFLGVVGLILGIVLAGPVVRDLVVGIQQAPREKLEADLEQSRQRVDTLVGAIAGWEAERIELVARLQAGGHADLAALQADPAALGDLDRLGKVDDLIALADQRLDHLRSALAQAEAKLAEDEVSDEEAALLEALGLGDGAPTDADLTPVEEFARQKRMQALFESLGQ